MRLLVSLSLMATMTLFTSCSHMPCCKGEKKDGVAQSCDKKGGACCKKDGAKCEKKADA